MKAGRDSILSPAHCPVCLNGFWQRQAWGSPLSPSPAPPPLPPPCPRLGLHWEQGRGVTGGAEVNQPLGLVCRKGGAELLQCWEGVAGYLRVRKALSWYRNPIFLGGLGGKARVLSSETKKRLGFFSLNYNDTILHFFKFEEPIKQTSDFS